MMPAGTSVSVKEELGALKVTGASKPRQAGRKEWGRPNSSMHQLMLSYKLSTFISVGITKWSFMMLLT